MNHYDFDTSAVLGCRILQTRRILGDPVRDMLDGSSNTYVDEISGLVEFRAVPVDVVLDGLVQCFWSSVADDQRRADLHLER